MNEAAVSFRPLQPEELSLLHTWVQRPHVAQWWHAPRTADDIVSEYLPVAEGRSSTRAYIASVGAAPMGFIQSYVVVDSGDGWWPGEADPGARGIDQFLVDGARLGQGLGTLMIRAFMQELFADAAITQVQTDPAPDNARAIRCYEKCGFGAEGLVITPDGPALLMRHVRP